MPDFIDQFHFIRPLWLLASIPCLLLALYFWRRKNNAIHWQGAIDKKLLGHLAEETRTTRSNLPWLWLLLCWLLASIALAGPAWKKLPQPIHQRQHALVIVLDLSLSMLAEDIQPSRLARAQHKILDILATRNEGLSALIAYSGDAHIVSPLSDDTDTIANLVPALSPQMMPLFGSNPGEAFELAKQLFINAGISDGQILLITDDITERDIDRITRATAGHRLSVLGIGTDQGAPIPAPNGFLKDNDGNIIVPKMHRKQLETLAANNNGRYSDVSIDDRDITALLADNSVNFDNDTVLSEREFDQWLDNGPLLVLLILPFALLAFRRGWLLLLPLCLLFDSPQSYALDWSALKHPWQTRDQRGATAFEQGDFEAAEQHFADNQWRGSASYRKGDFAASAQAFSETDSADSHYNRGNALARAGELEQAIAAYEQALSKAPDMEDAQFNKALVEQLLQQQQTQQQSQQQSQKQDQQEQSSEQQNNDSQQQSQADQSGESQQQQSSEQASQQQNAAQTPDDQQAEQQNPQSAQQSDQQESAAQQQQAQQQNTGDETKNQPQEQTLAAKTAEQLAQEAQAKQQQQATEQWLRQIPDDPSGLLRRKFQYEHQQKRNNRQQEQPQW